MKLRKRKHTFEAHGMIVSRGKNMLRPDSDQTMTKPYSETALASGLIVPCCRTGGEIRNIRLNNSLYNWKDTTGVMCDRNMAK